MTLRLTPEQFKAHQARVTVETAPTKYRNKPTGGYDSAKEAKRAEQLRLLEKSGMIRKLREQVAFILIPAQRDASGKLLEKSCKYYADFVYESPVAFERKPDPLLGPATLNPTAWEEVIEDVKSPASRTTEYVIKRKLMLYVHGIRIRET